MARRSGSGSGLGRIALVLAVVSSLAGAGYWLYEQRMAALEDDSAEDEAADEGNAIVDAAAKKVNKKGGGKRKAAAAKPAPRSATPKPRPPHVDYGPPGTSYETALAGNRQQVNIGAANGAPDLTDDQLAGPMRNGTFLDACGAPESMHVQVKVAIRNGRAAGVTVTTTPHDAEVSACIDHAVRGLAWPFNAKMDSFVTNY